LKKAMLITFILCFVVTSVVFAGYVCKPASKKVGDMCPCEGKWLAHNARVCLDGHLYKCVKGNWVSANQNCNGTNCCGKDICKENPNACK
jgi:hypothetical protein